MTAAARARIPLILLGALILQTSLLEGVRAAGVPTDALLLVAVVGGAVAGPERGAIIGFMAGLLADLFLQTPLGLSALAYCLVGFGVGTLSGNVIRAAWWIMPVTAFVGSLAGVAAYAFIGAVVGQSHLVRPSLALTALGVAIVNTPLSLLVGRAMTWAVGSTNDRTYAGKVMTASRGGDSGPLRLGVLGIVVVSLFAALLSRLWYLQVMDSRTFQVEARSNQVRVVYEEAPRGRILDRNGKILVDNRGSQVVTVDRNEVKDKPEVVGRLAALLNVPLAELRKRMTDVRFSPYTPVPVAEEVPEDIVIYLREHQDQFPGIAAPTRPLRSYPNGSLAAHLLGYVGQTTKEELDARRSKGYREGDEIGKQGIEKAYEDDLRGTPGSKRLQVNSAGKVLGPPLLETSPKQGRDLYLTVDLDIQTIAEQSLAQGLDAARRFRDREDGKDFVAPAGSVVVLNPQDGSVLAMASFPTFDPGQFVNGIKPDVFRALQDPASHAPLNNRVIQGLYSPGLTFKLFTSIAAVEKGLVDARTTILDGGSYHLKNCRGERCVFRNAGGISHGKVNLTRAITVSSDVYFYQLGATFWGLREQHPDAMQEVARRLGLGERTGIPVSPEAVGRIPDPATRKRLHDQSPNLFPNGEWRTGDNVNLSIGQGEMAVTPLQLANAYGTFANGGSLFQPRVVDKVVGQDRRVHRQIAPVKLRSVDIPAAAREPIVAGLRGVIANGEGTAHGAFAGFPLDRMSVAGKTGTAQVAKKQDTALFVCFAPVENPQYVVAVVMEESGFGGSVAAPVARRILEKIAGGQDTGASVVAGGNE